MEMVSQETVSESIYNLINVFRIELQEIAIVPLFDEDILTVITAVIDVVSFPVL
jgi:hypothetical protein